MAVRARDDVGVAQVSGEPGSGKRADYPAAHGASSTLFKLPLEVVLGRDIGTEARTEQPRACCPQVAELGVLQQNGRYLLVTAEVLAQSEAVFAASVALKVDPNAPAEEDPYADPQYQVPDDLVW